MRSQNDCAPRIALMKIRGVVGLHKSHTSEGMRSIVRFFGTYLLVWLPIFLIGVSISEYTFHALQRQEESMAELRASRFADSLNELFANYAQNSPLLISAAELAPGKMLSNDFNALVGFRRLNEFDRYDFTASNIFISYADGYIYSSSGYSRAFTHFYNVLNCDSASTNYAIESLQSEGNGATLLWRKDGECMLMLSYTNIVGTDPNVCVGYIIPESQILQRIQPLMDTEPHYINLYFDNGGGVQFSLSSKKSISTTPLNNTVASKDGIIIKTSVDTLRAELYVSYSAWNLYDAVRWNQCSNCILLIVGAIASIVISLWFSRNRQQKIHRLEAVLDGSIVDDTQQDEYNLIRAKIQYTLLEAHKSRQNEKISRRSLRRQTALLLFHGLIKDRAEANKILELGEVELYEEYFFLCGISHKETPETQRALEEEFGNELYCDIALANRAVKIVLLELPNDDTSHNLQNAILERLAMHLQNAGAKNTCIAASRVYRDPSQACFAYQEIIGLLSKAQDSEEIEIRHWEHTTSKEKDLYQIVQQNTAALIVAMEYRDAASALINLRVLLETLQPPTIPEENQHYLRYCVLHSLILAAQDRLDDENNALLHGIKAINPADPKNFATNLEKLVVQYTAQEDSLNMDFQRILDYIQQNYSDSNLTAEQVAEFSGVNKTYLSRLFRAHTGTSYINYLTEVRMNAAKALLKNTSLPLRDIVMRVGYIDVSSFRRKFKALYGISALEYRLQESES